MHSLERPRPQVSRLVISVVALCTLALQTGCAAAFRGTRAPITVSSVPEGATVQLSGRTLGTTPTTAEIPRQGHKSLQIRSPGYEPTSVQLDRRINAGWAVADVLTCVIPVLLCVPLIVDAITGAWMDVEPQYLVTLQPERQPAAAPQAPAAALPPPSPPPTAPTQ